jgi:hypothetical protein
LVVKIENLVKCYGDLVALDHFNLEILSQTGLVVCYVLALFVVTVVVISTRRKERG